MRIGLAGVGHLGKIHLKCLLNTEFELSGFYDPDENIRKDVQSAFGVHSFNSFDELLDSVDAVDIVSPTIFHHEIAKQAICKGKHVFIEKPLTESLIQAEELTQLAFEFNKIVQVGHVERYNPAITSLKDIDINPGFIEAHRLAMFNPRGTDVSVVLDLMIHDIDIVLSLIRAKIIDVRANGICIVSNTPDICNARIEFEGGAVANLTASRVSMKNMRKIRLFQRDAYISLDFLQKNAQVIKIQEDNEADNFSGMTLNTNNGKKRIIVETPEIMHNNAIQDELNDFYESIVNNKPVSVTIEDGYKALKLAHLIEEKMKNNNA
ncbi:MAG: Gfo/Idh/MocA family oxidoreductase [Saprospiraceae bacterium]|nr:Gfo/Idh/MocA family oxidoreductase [Saprospiraceae bacterium]MBL0024840.1 Gfo/Idh/MocA family oxidoreductase [Saprospiraceae bacterium]